MEAPKCKSCGKNHWERVCPVHGTTDAITVSLKPVVHTKKPVTVGPDAKVLKPPETNVPGDLSAGTVIDLKAGYNAYMRDYMRKKRAKDKENKP